MHTFISRVFRVSSCSDCENDDDCVARLYAQYLCACVWVCVIAADDEYRLLLDVHISTSGRRRHVIVSHLPGSDRDCPACA